MLRDVVRGDRLARWSRRAAAHAERCLALAAAALAGPAARDDDVRYLLTYTFQEIQVNKHQVQSVV